MLVGWEIEDFGTGDSKKHDTEITENTRRTTEENIWDEHGQVGRRALLSCLSGGTEANVRVSTDDSI